MPKGVYTRKIEHQQQIRTCLECGKIFKIYKYQIGKFCSYECYWKNIGNGYKNCSNCGVSSIKKFCSDNCKKEFLSVKDPNERAKIKFWSRKINLLSLLGNKCKKCGITDKRVLDIHHIDSSRKIKPLNRCYTWLRRLKDWKENEGNLELLCANCHRIHTWNEKGYGQYKYKKN
jgi:hypothetical protein